jgi:hypothetical protein
MQLCLTITERKVTWRCKLDAALCMQPCSALGRMTRGGGGSRARRGEWEKRFFLANFQETLPERRDWINGWKYEQIAWFEKKMNKSIYFRSIGTPDDQFTSNRSEVKNPRWIVFTYSYSLPNFDCDCLWSVDPVRHSRPSSYSSPPRLEESPAAFPYPAFLLLTNGMNSLQPPKSFSSATSSLPSPSLDLLLIARSHGAEGKESARERERERTGSNHRTVFSGNQPSTKYSNSGQNQWFTPCSFLEITWILFYHYITLQCSDRGPSLHFMLLLYHQIRFACFRLIKSRHYTYIGSIYFF